MSGAELNQAAGHPRLVIVSGPQMGQTFELLLDRFTIGRHSETNAPLQDPKVSRKHCELRRLPSGRYQLLDLNSGNGTQVNDQWIQALDLQHQDRIRIGDTTFLFLQESTATLRTEEPTRVIVQPAPPPPPEGQPASTIGPVGGGMLRVVRADEAQFQKQRQDAATLRVMFEVAEVVAQQTNLEALLGRVLELLLRSIPADHACALMFDEPGGPLLPRAVRSRSGAAGPLVVSHTVLDLVLKPSQAVLIRDAATDERVRQGESIARHQLRDVLCVPLRGRRETVGALFLDTVQGRRLDEDHLPLAVAIGHQAAVAVEEIRHYEARLQAERLAVIGQTIAAMSHHIKNIMQGIRFGSDMVRMGLAGDPELLHKGWKLVERNQNRIDELILDMLNYSKAREAGQEPTDIRELVGEIVEFLRPLASERGVEIVWEPAWLPPVPCDPAGIHRAVLNILGNALDAVESVPAGRVEVRLEPAETHVDIVIQDNGPGIPPERLPDLFKPFVSTKGSRGTGLGLPVSLKILQEHGGDIQVDSPTAAGGGARFRLRLPKLSPVISPGH